MESSLVCGCRPSLRASLDAEIDGAVARGVDRRTALRSLAVMVSMALTGCATVPEQHRAAADDIARETTSVDLHAHPGMFRTSPQPMEAQAERLAKGHVATTFFAAVGDGPLIGTRATGGLYATREPRPGELYTATWRQLEAVQGRVSKGVLKIVGHPADIDAAARQGVAGALLAVEGGDFLEGRLDRVEEAHRRGVHSIQLVHYRVNELGDIQTEPARHGGLTAFGKDVLREMNRLGMVVDLAHATHDAVKQAVAVARKPCILSHTVLETPFARSISREHAKLVADSGGVVGIFPVNSTYHGFSGYITHLERMIAAVGADHVGIGTDMDGIAPASFVAWDDYREWPTIGAALLARGHPRADVAKVLGGNFRRVFAEVSAV